MSSLARSPYPYILIIAAITLIAGGAEASGGLPMAEEWSWKRDGGRIFNAAVVIGAVVWLIVKYGGPILRNRADQIARQFEELEAARIKAKASLEEYEKKVKDIEAEGDKIRAEAKAEAELIGKKIVEQAEADSKRIVEKASEQIIIETEKAKAELRRQTTMAAIDLAEELLKKNIDSSDQQRLVKDYLDSVEKVN